MKRTVTCPACQLDNEKIFTQLSGLLQTSWAPAPKYDHQIILVFLKKDPDRLRTLIGKHLNNLSQLNSSQVFENYQLLRETKGIFSPKRTSTKVQSKIQMKLIVYESPVKVRKRTKSFI